MGGMKRQLIEDKALQNNPLTLLTVTLTLRLPKPDLKVLENKNGGPKKLSHLDMMMQSWVAAEMMNAESSEED